MPAITNSYLFYMILPSLLVITIDDSLPTSFVLTPMEVGAGLYAWTGIIEMLFENMDCGISDGVLLH